jgi:hypothetical protein
LFKPFWTACAAKAALTVQDALVVGAALTVEIV